MNTQSKILIVGAGIAGLYLGATLKKKGFKPLIIEKTKEWYPGYTLGIWNNGYKMLRELGLGEKFEELSEPIKNYYICNGGEEIDVSLNLKELFPDFDHVYAHISRKNLHQMLLNECGGIEIKRETTIKTLEQRNNKSFVTFSNGQSGEFDLVVGADGINSQVRSIAFPNENFVDFVDWRCWYFWIKDGINMPKGAFEIGQADKFFIGFPHSIDGWCGFVALPQNHKVPEDPTQRKEYLAKHFKNNSTVSKLLGSIDDYTEVRSSDLGHVEFDKPWYKDNIVFIGDSAHAFEPVAALGSTMAMEDAYVLADELIKTDDLNIALEKYYVRRKDRVANAQRITREMWWMTSSTNLIFVTLREILLKKFMGHLKKHFVGHLDDFFAEMP